VANVKDKNTGKVYLVVTEYPQGLVLKDADDITFALPKDAVVVTTTTTLSRIGA
jgi:hypothetical protein